MADFPAAVLASARTACTGGVVDVHMVVVTMISRQRRIHMIRRIQMNRHEHYGVTGINPENKRIGVEVELFTQCHTVNTS